MIVNHDTEDKDKSIEVLLDAMLMLSIEQP